MPEDIIKRISNDFTHHRPRPEDIPKFGELREMAYDLAIAIAELCPPGRECALALTSLEQAIMWANAGIARQGTPAAD